MVIFNALSSFNLKGLFVGGGVGNLSDKYYTDVTPAGFTFSIWGVIYFWQAVWLLGSVISICRQGINGPLYRSPILLPPVFFIIYILNNAINTTWLFVWDREILIAAFVILALDAISLYICIGISMKYLNANMGVLRKANLGGQKWWIWIAVQNGLAIYATWTSIATTLNMAVVMEYVSGVDHEISGTVALSFVAAGFLFWSIFELSALDKYARYLFMPYLVVCWALGGAIAAHWGKDWDNNDRNAIYTATILAVAVALGVIKFILLFYRHFKKPLDATEITSTLNEKSGL